MTEPRQCIRRYLASDGSGFRRCRRRATHVYRMQPDWPQRPPAYLCDRHRLRTLPEYLIEVTE